MCRSTGWRRSASPPRARQVRSSPTATPSRVAGCRSTPTAAASPTPTPACMACSRSRRACGKSGARHLLRCPRPTSAWCWGTAECSPRQACWCSVARDIEPIGLAVRVGQMPVVADAARAGTFSHDWRTRRGDRMSLIALFTWITAAGGGLYLLSIWLIEYDKEFQATAATRLPPVVLVSHVTLAGGGLIVWAGYLIFDNDNLVWVSALALLLAATLGSFMASRWVGVYRETRAIRRAATEQE